MTNIEIDLPADWSEKNHETQRSVAVVEYQHKTVKKNTFIVSVLPRPDNEGYRLRLSTINPTSTHIRHDYPVDEYDTVEDAVEEAESFIEQFSQRLRDGFVSSADPEIEAIQDTIQAFTGNQLFPSIQRLFRRF